MAVWALSGLSQIKAFVDALEPLFDSVDALVETGNLTVDSSEFSMNTRELMFHSAHTCREVVHTLTQSVDCAADVPHRFENQIAHEKFLRIMLNQNKSIPHHTSPPPACLAAASR
jgi:hypothetical protein